MKRNLRNILALIFVLYIFSSCAPTGFVKSDNHSIIHKSSGMLFPEKIDRFVRLKPIHYAPNNVSVGYQITDSDCFITITTYIYQVEGLSFEKEFTRAEEAIEYYYEEKLNEEKEIKLYQMQDSVSGKMASYDLISYPNGEVFFQTSYLYLFDYKGWFIKYRITHPNSSFSCADNTIGKFIENFQWTLNN